MRIRIRNPGQKGRVPPGLCWWRCGAGAESEQFLAAASPPTQALLTLTSWALTIKTTNYRLRIRTHLALLDTHPDRVATNYDRNEIENMVFPVLWIRIGFNRIRNQISLSPKILKFYCWKKIHIFLQKKIAIQDFIPRPSWMTSKLQEKPPAF